MELGAKYETGVAGLEIVWGHPHTANVYAYGREVDCFTFSWAIDRPQLVDFIDAAKTYMSAVDLYEIGI
jgi:hypothetical protein